MLLVDANAIDVVGNHEDKRSRNRD